MNLAKLYAQFVGIVLTLVGIVSFFSFLQLRPLSSALAPGNGLVPGGSYYLLGIFAVNPLHNVIHILTGLLALGVWLYGGGRYVRWYALVFGAVYAVVTLVGIVQGNTLLGLIPINLPDDILHTLLAAGGLGAYFLTSPAKVEAA
jgi:hypothetical protein